MSKFVTENLIKASKELNETSDRLNQPIIKLDEDLQKLNVGLSTWIAVEYRELNELKGSWKLELGYAKVDSKWGIAIRETINSPSGRDDNSWHFIGAPRAYRIAVIDKIPELIEHLTKAAEKTTIKLQLVIAELEKRNE